MPEVFSIKSRSSAPNPDSIVDSMADARAAVIDARLWVRNPISIVISSANASAALGARHKIPPSSPGRMTGRVGYSKGVSPLHFSDRPPRGSNPNTPDI